MPRVENYGFNVTEWYQTEARGNGTSTHDVCMECYEQLRIDPHAFDDAGLYPYNGDPQGDLGFGGDVEHPPYYDDEYYCQVSFCRRLLTQDEDGYPENPFEL